MEKRSEKRNKSSIRAPGGKKKVLLWALSFLVIAGVSGCTFILFAKDKVKAWDTKIYPGVTVQGINLSGMTEEEAKNKLSEEFQTQIENKKLPIIIGDKQYELIYSDITPIYDIDKTVESAYNLGKNNGILKKYMDIRNDSNKETEVPLIFSYDEDKLKAYEEKLKNEVSQSAQDASITIEKNNIIVKQEIEGKSINLDTLDQKIKDNINGEISSNNSVNIEIEITKPKVTKSELSKIKGVMGTFSTSYSTSTPGRCNNIEIATKAINGTIVMPGEVFSFNDIVGPRTIERGYQEAGTYVGNKIEPGIGGGICQVSTTIYRAAMKANLRSVERTNHSMAVGYAKPGLDATVSYGYLDYKFKNTYDFPIYIQGDTSGKVVTYNIYGDSSALNGKTYDMTNEILQTIPPETKVIPDNSLPEGKEVSENPGVTGYKANSYQVTYENGVEVKREIVSSDTYVSAESVIRRGTQPVNTNAKLAQSTNLSKTQSSTIH